VSDAVDSVRTNLGLLGDVLTGLEGSLGTDQISAQLCQDQIDEALGALGTALGTDLGGERAGLLLQGGKLKAARFMTIAPDALPQVADDYDGPLTDYLGVGPKIVRLVR
jgi:hypothetical protein